MKPHWKLLIVLIAIALITCILGSALKPVADWWVTGSSWAAEKFRYDENNRTYDYGQIFRRIMMGTALVLFVGLYRWMELQRLSNLGLAPKGHWVRSLLAGVSIGIVSLAVYMFLLWLIGVRKGRPIERVFPRLPVFVLQACAIGLLEEIIFRGFILQTLLKSLRRISSVLLASGVYSILHFFDGRAPVAVGADPLVGFKVFGRLMCGLASPLEILAAFVGLLLVGVVLSYAYIWSGTLYLPIGLHAGWVLALKCSSKLLCKPHVCVWLFGSNQIVDGLASFLFLAAVFMFLRHMYKYREGRGNEVDAHMAIR